MIDFIFDSRILKRAKKMATAILARRLFQTYEVSKPKSFAALLWKIQKLTQNDETKIQISGSYESHFRG